MYYFSDRISSNAIVRLLKLITVKHIKHLRLNAANAPAGVASNHCDPSDNIWHYKHWSLLVVGIGHGLAPGTMVAWPTCGVAGHTNARWRLLAPNCSQIPFCHDQLGCNNEDMQCAPYQRQNYPNIKLVTLVSIRRGLPQISNVVGKHFIVYTCTKT